MAKQNLSEENNNGFEAIETNLSKTEAWIEKNQKVLTIIVAAIVVVIIGIFCVKNYVIEPKNQEAQEQIFFAEKYFETEQFEQALNGDGNNLGFLDIISEYKSTKTGKLACYYAGICYLNMGQFDDAIKYLKKFNGKDNIVAPMALGGIGDANWELGNLNEAASYYMKAANKSKNAFTAPMYLMRAAAVYEEMGEYSKAVKAYETIKYDYTTSNECVGIEKYIEFAKAHISK